MKEEKTYQNRKMILDYLRDHPGSHMRLISREINMKMGTLRHHLKSLEKENKIISRKERNLKTYFVKGLVGAEDRKISSLFHQKRFKEIVVTIIHTPGSNQKTISEKTGINPPSLSKYIHILEEGMIVRHDKIENEKKYYVINEKKIIQILKTYKKSFWDSYVDNALELWYER